MNECPQNEALQHFFTYMYISIQYNVETVFIAITISHSTDALHINYCVVALMPPQTIQFFIPFYLLLLRILLLFHFLFLLFKYWFDISSQYLVRHCLSTHYFSQVVSKLWTINFNEKSLAHRSNCAFITICFKAYLNKNSHHFRMMRTNDLSSFQLSKTAINQWLQPMNIQQNRYRQEKI